MSEPLDLNAIEARLNAVQAETTQAQAARALRDFLNNAPTDIETLIAEVRRLTDALATARLDGARVMHRAVRQALIVNDPNNRNDWHDAWDRVLHLDPAAVVGSAPIASPALGCTACPNFVAEGGNAGGWRCRAVDDSIVVGLWIDEATGATNGYMPDGSAGEVPTDARTCPAFGKPAVAGSGS